MLKTLKALPLKQIGTALLFLSILLFAFWIRSGILPRIPPGQFIGNDSYFYYEQARTISENGKLPEIDTNRWVPHGRDLSQTLPFYSYVLAYTHKALASVFPNVSLYHWVLYVPVLCFCIGLGTLCFFLQKHFGTVFSFCFGILFATFPGTLERSVIGFSDRDNWVLMIGILSVITYLTVLQAETSRKRLFWTLISGFIVFLGGLSWEGFGVFLSVILVVELWRFLTSETENGFGFYAVWVCCFVPTLYLASPAYRNGYGFAAHLAAFVLIPPLALLAMRTLRHLLLVKNDAFLPLRFTLTAGERHDVREAPALIIGNHTCEYIVADAAYDCDALREMIVAQGAVAVIRPRKNRIEDRPYDEEIYKRRNVIERFFHRLKQYRRVATRYDKYANRYLGFVYFAAILITANKM